MGKISDWLGRAQGLVQRGWEIEIIKVFIVLAIYFAFLVLALTLYSALLRKNRNKLEPSSYTALKMVGRMFIISMFAAAFLNQFAQFQGTLLGFSALVGTAIGFASTQTIGNFVAGIYVIITRPFSVGDYVILPSMDIEGVVEEITINYTSILLPNHTRAMVANRAIIDARIINTRREHEKPTESKGQVQDKTEKSEKNHDSKRKDWAEESKELFKAIFDDDKVVKYDYPLVFGVDTSVPFSTIESMFSEIIPPFEQEFIASVTWNVGNVSRLETKYEVIISVSNAKDLLEIPKEFLLRIKRSLEQSTSS